MVGWGGGVCGQQGDVGALLVGWLKSKFGVTKGNDFFFLR